MKRGLERTLVVLEDSDEDFDTVVEAMDQEGLKNKIIRAASGDECMALLEPQGGKAGSPSLILLDLNVPGLDGRSVLRELKRDPKCSSIPVVVISTSSNPRDIETCYEIGANAYHIKPVRYPEYRAGLQQLLRYWLDGAALPEGRRR